MAAYHGSRELVEIVLGCEGVHVNFQNKSKITALQLAAGQGHTDMVRLLLQIESIEVNMRDWYGATALHNASCKGHIDIVRLLLQHESIAVNTQDVPRQTALFLAAMFGQTDVVKLLLQQKRIDVNIQDEIGQTPLFIAVHNEHTETVEVLLEHPDLDVNLTTIYGLTPLYSAVHDVAYHKADNASSKARMEIVKLLLNHKCVDVNIQAPLHGATTPLHVAAAARPAELTSRWSHTGAGLPSCDTKSVSKESAVIPADLSIQYVEIVKLLLENVNVDINIENEFGETALQSAQKMKNIQIIELLSRHKMKTRRRGETNFKIVGKGELKPRTFTPYCVCCNISYDSKSADKM